MVDWFAIIQKHSIDSDAQYDKHKTHTRYLKWYVYFTTSLDKTLCFVAYEMIIIVSCQKLAEKTCDLLRNANKKWSDIQSENGWILKTNTERTPSYNA